MAGVIELLNAANPQVVLEGVPGHNNIMIRCPFHGGGQERTPSCSVHLERPVFFCHGCHEGGHLSRLLRELGMPIDLVRSSIDRAQFSSTQGPARRQGLIRKYRGPSPYRGSYILDEEFLDDFRLAPTPLLRAGFLKDTLRHFEVGFDQKRMRMTFPLRNIFGELVGLSGRTVIDQHPRYKIYRQELTELVGAPEDYTLDEVKKVLLWHGHIIYPVLYKKPEPVVITEGFKAAMWVWQAGIHNVVALIGSYLTQYHAELFSTLQCPLTLFLDNNEAGHVGTLKAVKRLNANKVNVAKYPDLREQPDDLTKEEVLEAVRQAENYIRWTRRHRNAVSSKEYPRRKQGVQKGS